MFVHLADIHIGKTYKGKKFFNWDLFRNITKEIIDLSPDFILISGDLFDKPLLDNETLIETINIFKKFAKRDIPIFTIEGNHDCNNFSLSYYYLFSQLNLINNLSSGDKIGYLKKKYDSEFVEFKEIKIKDKIFYKAKGIINTNNIKEIHGLANIRTKEVLDSLLRQFKDSFYSDKSILMLHQTVEDISGGVVEENSINIGQLLELGYKYYALGHIHKSNVLENKYLFKNSFFVYSGSIDVYDKKNFHKITYTKKMEINKSITGYIISDLKEIEFKRVNNSNYYFVYLEYENKKDLEKKMEEIKEVIKDCKAIIDLFSFEKMKKEVIYDLIEKIFEKEQIIDINFNNIDENPEINLENGINFYSSKINQLLNQFEIIKTSNLTKDYIKQKVLELVKEVNLNELLEEMKNLNELDIEKKSEIKKEVKKIEKEKKGIFKFIK